MRGFMALLALLGVISCASADEGAKKRLDSSPRHHEWVDVKAKGRTVRCFLVFPEVKDKATAVLVIHENKGLSDWVRSVADQLAEAGIIAIAPDLLSGAAPGGGATSDFATVDAATQAIYKLPPAQVTSDLRGVADYVVQLPAANGKLAVAGFCWGGGQSLRFATDRADLKAAFVFYGATPLDEAAAARINCPVYGFYGGNDARINTTVPATAALLKKTGKKFEPVTYEGAGHGFMRLGDDPQAPPANRAARDKAWQRWKEILKAL